MRKAILYILPCFLFLMLSSLLMAQPTEVEMADGMRSNGKIYVVVAVMSTILAGLILYLISLDRRIGKMERNAE